MKVIACCPLFVAGVKVAVGESFAATEYSAAKLIARGAAKPPVKAKPKKKAQAAEE